MRMKKKVDEGNVKKDVDIGKERLEKKREYHRKYYAKHKNERVISSMKYRNANKDIVNEKKRNKWRIEKTEILQIKEKNDLMREKLEELGYEDFLNDIEVC